MKHRFYLAAFEETSPELFVFPDLLQDKTLQKAHDKSLWVLINATIETR
jgi:hypothetical protein